MPSFIKCQYLEKNFKSQLKYSTSDIIAQVSLFIEFLDTFRSTKESKVIIYNFCSSECHGPPRNNHESKEKYRKALSATYAKRTKWRAYKYLSSHSKNP